MQNIIFSSDNVNDMDEASLVLQEFDDRFVIYGKITNVIDNNININYQQDYMTIVYTKIFEQSVGNGWANINIQQSKTENKTFYVPNIDPVKVSATYENYVLNVIMMKNKSTDINNVGSEIIDVEEYFEVE